MSQNVWELTTITVLSILQFTQAWEIRCYNGSLTNYETATYDNAGQLITSGCVDVEKDTVAYAFGYTSTIDRPGTVKILQAYIDLADRNVLAINWSNESNTLDILSFGNYPIIAMNAEKIGKELAIALQNMTKCGLKPEKTHLIGLSMGAHLVAIAARAFFKLVGKLIALVTGLDPAKVGYDDPTPIYERINKTCAEHVTIIHTDCHKYGVLADLGHTDFWLNIIQYDNNETQPGCPARTLFTVPFSDNDICNHRFSLEVLVDSTKYPCLLLAGKFENKEAWKASNSTPSDVTCIGDKMNRSSTGKFYLRTNGKSPYGLGELGLRP